MHSGILLDLVAVLLVVVCVWSGYRKGILRTIAQVAVYVAILGLSAYGSGFLAATLYDRVVEPAIMDQLLQQLPLSTQQNGVLQNAPAPLSSSHPATDTTALSPASLYHQSHDLLQLSAPTVSTTFRSPFSPISSPLSTSITIYPEDLSSLLSDLLSQLDLSGAFSLDGGVQNLVSNYLAQSIRPTVLAALKIICFVLLFLILSIVANILLRVLGVIHYVPVLGGVNRFLGACLGFLQGCLLIWLINLLIQGAISLSGGQWWLFTSTNLTDGYIFPLLAQPLELLKNIPAISSLFP